MRFVTMRNYALLGALLICTVVAQAQQPSKDEIEVSDFSQTFYQHPDVGKVVPMLQKAMKLKWPDRPGISKEPTIYFFARMAELHPELLRAYEGLFDKADAQQRDLLIQVLKACGDAQTGQMLKLKLGTGKSGANSEAIKAALAEGVPKKFDLNRPAVTGNDLDVRWMEFFITGDPKDVGRIADAIDATEVVRGRTTAWLNDPSSATKAAQVAANAQEWIGLRIDVENRKVLNVEDTDLLLMDRNNRMEKPRFDAMKAALPFEFTQDDIMKIAVKGSALWSLASNAEQHPAVKKFLEAMMNDPRPRVRLACIRALAFAEFEKGEFRAAEEHANQYLRQSSNRDVGELATEAGYERELKENSEIVTPANAVKLDPETSARAHEIWVKSLESARALAAQTVIWDDKGNMLVHWKTLYQAPDRYDIMQTAWEGKNRQAIYDRWRYLGTENFLFFGMWVSGVPDQMDRASLSPALRGADILTSLKPLKPGNASRWTGGQQHVVLLEYSPSKMRVLGNEVGPTVCKIWLDEADGRVLRAELNYTMMDKKQKVPVKLTQVFGGTNARIIVERPADAMNLHEAAEKVTKKGK